MLESEFNLLEKARENPYFRKICLEVQDVLESMELDLEIREGIEPNTIHVLIIEAGVEKSYAIERPNLNEHLYTKHIFSTEPYIEPYESYKNHFLYRTISSEKKGVIEAANTCIIEALLLENQSDEITSYQFESLKEKLFDDLNNTLFNL